MNRIFRRSWILLALVASFALPSVAAAATLGFVAGETSLRSGDRLIVDVVIDSENAGVNGVQATIRFPKELLSPTSTDKMNSVFPFWLMEPAIDRGAGTITFMAGSANGVSGKTLQVLRVTFEVVGTGSGALVFTDGAITASDGNGTNVLTHMKGIDLLVAPGASRESVTLGGGTPPVTQIMRPAVPTGKRPSAPEVAIPLYPHSGEWYGSIAPFLARWPLPRDVTAVAAEIDKKPATDPTSSEGLFDNKTFPPLSDGLWSVHVRFRNSVGWGTTTHHAIGIDTAPPLPFRVTIKEGRETHVSSPTVSFETKDQPSGIARYRIIVDGKEATSTMATEYLFPALAPGEHRITIEAEDRAGNRTLAETTIVILERPYFAIGWFSLTQFWFFVLLLALVLLAGFAGWYADRLWRARVERKVVIAERDVMNAFALVGSDLKKLAEYQGQMPSAERDAAIAFLLRELSERVEKARKYTAENIKEIDE